MAEIPSDVLFANRVEVIRNTDHFVLKLGLQANQGDASLGKEVLKLVLPLTTSIDLGLKLFEGMFLAAGEIQTYFAQIGERVNRLNDIKAVVENQVKSQAAGKK